MIITIKREGREREKQKQAKQMATILSLFDVSFCVFDALLSLTDFFSISSDSIRVVVGRQMRVKGAHDSQTCVNQSIHKCFNEEKKNRRG